MKKHIAHSHTPNQVKYGPNGTYVECDICAVNEETVTDEQKINELPYIILARNTAAKYANMSATLDPGSGWIEDEDFKIERCVWSPKDWNVTFTCDEKLEPNTLVRVTYSASADEIYIEMVEGESA